MGEVIKMNVIEKMLGTKTRGEIETDEELDELYEEINYARTPKEKRMIRNRLGGLKNMPRW